MNFFTRYFRPAVLALALCAPALALANAQDDLLSALDAYKANDAQRLASIATNMAPDPLRIYPSYWLTLMALNQNNDTQVELFLTQSPPSALTERVRRDWLKKLGKRQSWDLFEAQWSKLAPEGMDEETQCYGDLLTLRQGQAPANLDRFLDGRALPEGCNTLISAAAQRGLLNQDWLWKRMRLLLAANLTPQARQLASDNGLNFDARLLNNPKNDDLSTRQGQEAMLFTIESQGRVNLPKAADILSTVEPALGASAAGFGWGQLALMAALKQQMPSALQWYAKADRAQLNNNQWEWWARAALRSGQWDVLRSVIQNMPPSLAGKPVWLYWQGRALRALNHPGEAQVMFAKASQGNGYYSLLARDELGNSLSAAPEKSTPGDADINQIQNDPSIVRSLELFEIANYARKPELRSAAQMEWRWAMRGRSDLQLLAASEMARQAGFFDMAIYSAERTQIQHDFSLRYLMPYREITQRYASQLNIDDAWVYGLIRQESRFITAASSGVGASGLMQLMPKTAQWVARKIGLGTMREVNDVETNIQLGTWYLKYVLDSLADNPVLATAGYNAGPNRARAWQDSRPMDGTIYTETIPFSETRDYVQKVMTNAAYYASAMGHSSLSLKARMGTVPAKITASAINEIKPDPSN